MSKSALPSFLILLVCSLFIAVPICTASDEALTIHPMDPVALSTPTPEPEITDTPTPLPTLTPTPKVVPGSPLVFGNQFLTEMISQFDITAIAELVLVFLGVVWVIVILVYVDRAFAHKDVKKQGKSA